MWKHGSVTTRSQDSEPGEPLLSGDDVMDPKEATIAEIQLLALHL